uniref:Uncharacterized protein n=1 Tax=Haptolina brevifila TaxID=156173 RepID=A0A7S2D1C6_9EUKA
MEAGTGSRSSISPPPLPELRVTVSAAGSSAGRVRCHISIATHAPPHKEREATQESLVKAQAAAPAEGTEPALQTGTCTGAPAPIEPPLPKQPHPSAQPKRPSLMARWLYGCCNRQQAVEPPDEPLDGRSSS